MYVYGKNVAQELIANKRVIKKVYIYKDFKDKILLDNFTCPIITREKYELDKMVDGNHQGIIMEVPDYKYHELEEIVHDNRFVVILDHIEDPHNFGAIIRTCEAAGVDGIIIPKDRSVDVNPTVIRVSTGAIKTIKVAMVTNLVRTINELKEKGYWIVGTDMVGTDYDK